MHVERHARNVRSGVFGTWVIAAGVVGGTILKAGVELYDGSLTSQILIVAGILVVTSPFVWLGCMRLKGPLRLIPHHETLGISQEQWLKQTVIPAVLEVLAPLATGTSIWIERYADNRPIRLASIAFFCLAMWLVLRLARPLILGIARWKLVRRADAASKK